MERLYIAGITIEVVKKNIKNIHLGVYPPDGNVKVSAPLDVNEDALRFFIISKLNWIQKQIKTYKEQERITAREYKQNESHYLWGNRYLINIIEENAPPKIIVKSKKIIELHIRPNTPIKKQQEIMNEWYRNELKERIPPIIKKWEAILNVNVNSWHIRQMKTKWGSCNPKRKSILLNLELAKKPERCLEYIIVHEMIHLIEPSHNERFKNYLYKYYPSWEKIKRELNTLPLGYAVWKY